MHDKKHKIDPFCIIAFFWSFIFFSFNLPPVLSDFDTPWHIEAGRRIISESSLILNNGWSFSAQEHYWYNISWLWDVILYFFDHYFEIKSIYYFTTFIYGLIFFIQACYLRLDKEIRLLEITFTLFLTLLILWDFACARPQTATYLFISVFLYLLKKYSLKKQISILYPIPFLMILWVNIHGGFMIGCFLLISFFVDYIYKNKKIDKQFLTLSIITALTLFINPYGWKIVLGVTSTTSSAFTQSIDEWKSLSFGKELFVFCLYLILLITTANFYSKKIPFFDRFNTLIWLILSLIYVRNIPVFALISTYFATKNFSDRKLVRDLNINNYLSVKCYILIFLGIILSFTFPLVYKKHSLTTPQTYPSAAINYIQNNFPKLNFYNEYRLGGQIIYHSQGKQKVFVDGRAGTAYPERVLSDYHQFILDVCNKAEIINKYNIEGLIITKANKLEKMLKPHEWVKVFSDNFYRVYVKK